MSPRFAREVALLTYAKIASHARRANFPTGDLPRPLVVDVRSFSQTRYFRRPERYFPTGGLRPPLMIACTDAVAEVRFSPRGAIVSHGGLTPPAPGAVTTTVCRKNNAFVRCTNAYPQDGADGLYVSPSFVSLSFSSVERPSDGTHRACDVPWPLNRPD
jgi:hypothetical protein